LLGRHPTEILVAHSVDEVRPVLDRAIRWAEAGKIAAGFLAYEAAPAFDPAFSVHPPAGTPRAWFALYESMDVGVLPIADAASPEISAWRAECSPAEYAARVSDARDRIAAGETYQVNLTQRLRARCHADPAGLFAHLLRSQPTEWAAYLDLGGAAVASASPECFFVLEEDELLCKPMKGTAPRGRWTEEDEARRSGLAQSEKDRAENAMIVDMVRNDLGRIAAYGTVRVADAFAVEPHPTVFQMTGTVTARSHAPLAEIVAALFPAASITGAPKVRTMRVIRELETSPRGVYTGCIGTFGPGRRARFNVAIRTAWIDRGAGELTYGAGGGVVWDSTPSSEHDECLLKARVLTEPRPAFQLLETLRWRATGGFSLKRLHLSRLARSAAYFGFPVDLEEISAALDRFGAQLPPGMHRVRLLVERDGAFRMESAPMARSRPRTIRRVAWASSPVDEGDPFLFHKTTHRAVYEAARAEAPEADDVLLYNREGLLTESTIANVVLRLDGELVTPPVGSGLLAGTFREALLRRGTVRERPVRTGEVERAEGLWLVNSVRGWMPAEGVA
jgi:para-aminobenzoate synthetase/4-amino-4-deoxychorismate lyase